MADGKSNKGVHTRKVRQKIYRIYLYQAVFVLALAGGLYIWTDHTVALSALAAGLVYLIPNLYFVQKALAHVPGASAGKVLAQMYVSEIWKVVLTGVLFAAVFTLLKPISPLSLFSTFVLLQLTGSIAQARLKNSSRKL